MAGCRPWMSCHEFWATFHKVVLLGCRAFALACAVGQSPFMLGDVTASDPVRTCHSSQVGSMLPSHVSKQGDTWFLTLFNKGGGLSGLGS